MTTSDGVEAIRSAVQAVNFGDIDGYLRGFDASCLRWVSAIERPFTLVEVGENLRILACGFDGLRLDEESLFGEGDLVCARWKLQVTHSGDYLVLPPTVREIHLETCDGYRFEAGLVVESWAYGDPGQLFRQISSVVKGDGGARA